MPDTYRIFRLDRTNHIVEMEWVTAGSDEEALALARAMKVSGRCEVWLGARLVATIHATTGKEPSAAYWL